jgi:hypothetical protein
MRFLIRWTPLVPTGVRNLVVGAAMIGGVLAHRQRLVREVLDVGPAAGAMEPDPEEPTWAFPNSWKPRVGPP